VERTLIQRWASRKSFGGRTGPADDPGNPTMNLHGEKRSNETHEPTTDPDARLERKSGSHESKLAYSWQTL
jgi:hypothetical protein